MPRVQSSLLLCSALALIGSSHLFSANEPQAPAKATREATTREAGKGEPYIIGGFLYWPGPPISANEIAAFANRPLDNRGGNYWVTDRYSIAPQRMSQRLTVREFAQFLDITNNVHQDGVPVDFKNRLLFPGVGVLFTTNGACYGWCYGQSGGLSLVDERGYRFRVEPPKGEVQGVLLEHQTGGNLTPPKSSDILYFSNAPSLTFRSERLWPYTTPKRLSVNKDKFIAMLEDLKQVSFVSRSRANDLPDGITTPSTPGLTRSDGVLMLRSKKILFWELTPRGTLFLEDEDGASCLLAHE